MKSHRLLLILVLVAGVAGLAYYFYAGSDTPAGQQALVRLNAENFGDLKREFNAAPDAVRVIAMLSPT
jgi:hypothetical protein